MLVPCHDRGKAGHGTFSLWRALVHPHHHAGGLDDGVNGLALFELQLVRRLIGNRSSDCLAADIDADMGGCCSLLDLDNLAFELIACAEFYAMRSWLNSFFWCEAVAR
jgi:hypothetical protein